MTERENLLRSLTRRKPQWIPRLDKSAQLLSASCIHDREDNGVDWFGVRWKDKAPDPNVVLLDDIEDWPEKIRFPDLKALDWAAAAKADCAGLDRENKAVWVTSRVGPFERSLSFLGFEGALVALMTDTEEYAALIEAYTDFRLKELQYICKYYKPDIISIHDDYGTQKSLFMSPALWRSVFKPCLKRLVDYVHSQGAVYVQHCCGKIDAIIGDFVELGIDAWDSVQPCCDLKAIFDSFGGDISFTPGMNMQRLSGGTPEQARAEVRETIDTLGKYGGVSPRGDGPTFPPAISEAIWDEVEKYGRVFFGCTEILNKE